jgi:glutaredoxin-like protein NrdH
VTVDVYGKPGCVQCKYTNELLEKNGHDVQYHDITAEEEAKRIVEQSGKTQLPLVVAGEQSWHGLSPDKIKALSA